MGKVNFSILSFLTDIFINIKFMIINFSLVIIYNYITVESPLQKPPICGGKLKNDAEFLRYTSDFRNFLIYLKIRNFFLELFKNSQ